MIPKDKKKWILTVILLLCIGFIVTQNEHFYVEKNYKSELQRNGLHKEEGFAPEKISLSGNQTVEQEFVAIDSELERVSINFEAWEQKNGSGTIHVEVVSPEGDVLASAEKPLQMLRQSKNHTDTNFRLETTLTKNQTYKLVIRSEDVESEKGCYLYYLDSTGDIFGKTMVNGTEIDGIVFMSFRMFHFSLRSLLYVILVLILGIAFIWCPFDKILKK